jgi:Protein of unknown function (DUF3325)
MLMHMLLCSLAAFALLCLAMERHHEEALGEALTRRRRRWLRGLAVLAFLFSCQSVWPRADPGIAWTEWLAQMSLAGLAVVALATWRPGWLAPAALLCGLAGLLLGYL